MKLPAIAFAGWAICLTGAAIAHETTTAPKSATVVMTSKDGETEPTVIVTEVHRDVKIDGQNRSVHIANCDGNKDVVESTEESKDGAVKERVKIMMCSKAGQNGAAMAESLSAARAKIAANEQLEAATKERILARLDEHIARVKANAQPKPAK